MEDDMEEEEPQRVETERNIPRLRLTQVSVFIDDALNGDQLRLSPRILERIVHQEPISMSRGYGPDSIGRDSGRQTEKAIDGPMVFALKLQDKCVYGAPKEFTAKEERQVGVSASLAKALGIPAAGDSEKDISITLELAELPRGSFVRLAPLTPNYLLIPDIRSLLESHLRRNYTTLSLDQRLSVSYHLPGSLSSTQEIVDFQITHIVPSPACLCVNTDLEVDIQPTDEALAREAVERSMNAQKIPGSGAQAVSGTRLSWTEKDGNWICHVDPTSDLSMNETRVYALPTLSAPLTHYKVTVTPIASTSSSASADPDINVFISLTHDAPDLLHHHFLNVDHGVSNLYFRLTDPLPPVLYLGIQGASDVPSQFALDAQVSVNSFEQPQSSITTPTLDVDTERPVDSELCSNCQTWIPSRTIVMHRAFCERNNAKCDKCGRVMKRVDAATHWHCSVYDCDKSGHVREQAKHHQMFHKPIQCKCGSAYFLADLTQHRLTDCPERLIVCRFCHLLVRSGPPSRSVKDLYLGTNLSEHESECGARTIACVQCGKQVQLKDVAVHAQYHIIDRPVSCANTLCLNSINKQFPNIMSLCPSCFRPFYSSRHDPGNAKLYQSLIGAYHLQLMQGCGKEHCVNPYCLTSGNVDIVGMEHRLDATDAAILALDLFNKSQLQGSEGSGVKPEYFLCISDSRKQRIGTQ